MYFKFIDALKNKIFSSEFLRLKDSEIKKLMVFISKTEYENFIKSLFLYSLKEKFFEKFHFSFKRSANY
jgi:hypothetical protein